MKKHKILMITSKYPRFKNDPQPGFVHNFIKEVKNLGHDIAVIAPHDKNAKKQEIMDGIKVYRFKYFWPYQLQKVSYGPGIPANVQGNLLTKLQIPLFILFEFLLAKRIVKQFKPDFIHAHWSIPQGLIASLTNKPFFATVYGGDVFMSKKFHLTGLLDNIIKKSRKTIVITHGLEQIMRDFGIKNPVSIIPVGIDIKKFYPKYPGSGSIRKKYGKFVFFIGRHVEKKGAKYLIKAFADVVNKVDNIKLIIGGRGPLTAELKKLTSDLRLNDKVIFLGSIKVEDLPKFYAAAQLFVAPSIIDKIGDRETQGVVFLEAMASKCPVIGTSTGGIPDVISDKEVGMLVPQKDSKALAEKMISVLKNERLRKKYLENGYHHVLKNFTWDNIAKRYMDIYKKYL